MSSEDLRDPEALELDEESVLMLSSLLLAFGYGLILVGLEPLAACVCSCKNEGVDAMVEIETGKGDSSAASIE